MKNFVTFSSLGKMGELGNQMFQISATIGYAKKSGKTPIFPKWVCAYSGKNYSEIFNGPFDQTFVSEKLSSLAGRYTYNDLKYREIPVHEGNIDLMGYFQSENYFKNAENEIKSAFQFSDSTREYVEKNFKHIVSLNDKVSLHVRTAKRSANDYDVHSAASKEFIEKSQLNFSSNNYVVFADNMIEAKKILPEGKNYIFVEDQTNYVDLCLMTYFDQYIVSPSTFGWWGAYLSQNISPRVSIMKDWFAKDKPKAYLNENDIIPDRWTKIYL
jgi:hypothetical protein